MKVRRGAGFLMVIVALSVFASQAFAQKLTWDQANSSGQAYFLQGYYPEAEQQFLRAIKLAESSGPKDRRVATSLNNLAQVYEAQGRYQQAERALRRALGIIEKAFGPKDPQVVATYANLAQLYAAQGKHRQALTMQNRANAIRAKLGFVQE